METTFIDNNLFDELSTRAKVSARLRKNLNFHESMEYKCHRFQNTYNDDGSVIESIILDPLEGRYGVNVKKNVWHTVKSLEPGSCLFECMEEPYVPHGVEEIMLRSEK